MNTPTTKQTALEQWNREAGGWITCRVPQPAADPSQLLSESTAGRPGNLRYTLDREQVYLLGELHDTSGQMTVADARGRLFPAAGAPPQQVSAVEVASALDETGLAWSQLPDNLAQWQAIAHDQEGCRCELLAQLRPGGVDIHSPLTVGEGDLQELCESALLRFVTVAQGSVRGARFTWQERRLSAVSFAAASRLEIELADSVAAVVAACRLVRREARALADTAVARAYLKTTV